MNRMKILMAPEGDTNGGAAEKAAAEKATADKAAADKIAADKAAADKSTLLTATDGDKAKADEIAPVEVKITVPQGFTVDQKRVDGFVAFAKENKISQESAQKFFDQYVEQHKSDVQAAEHQRAETFTGWAEESRKAFGKEFDSTIADAKKAMTRFGDAEVSKLLQESGLGNHKAVIALLAKAGKAVTEDKLIKEEGSPAKKPLTDREKAQAMYPKSPEMWGGTKE